MVTLMTILILSVSFQKWRAVHVLTTFLCVGKKQLLIFYNPLWPLVSSNKGRKLVALPGSCQLNLLDHFLQVTVAITSPVIHWHSKKPFNILVHGGKETTIFIWLKTHCSINDWCWRHGPAVRFCMSDESRGLSFWSTGQNMQECIPLNSSLVFVTSNRHPRVQFKLVSVVLKVRKPDSIKSQFDLLDLSKHVAFSQSSVACKITFIEQNVFVFSESLWNLTLWWSNVFFHTAVNVCVHNLCDCVYVNGITMVTYWPSLTTSTRNEP